MSKYARPVMGTGSGPGGGLCGCAVTTTDNDKTNPIMNKKILKDGITDNDAES